MATIVTVFTFFVKGSLQEIALTANRLQKVNPIHYLNIDQKV